MSRPCDKQAERDRDSQITPITGIRTGDRPSRGWRACAKPLHDKPKEGGYTLRKRQ